MADLKYYDVILRPIITEKSMMAMNEEVQRSKKDSKGKVSKESVTIRKYSFYVHPQATKIQIKQAVEKMFDGVKVENVNTMNVRGQQKRVGRFVGKTAAKKKAVVTLKQDSKDIELFAAN